MLEIVSDASSEFVLEKLGVNKNNIIELPFLLNVGDLGELSKGERYSIKKVLFMEYSNFSTSEIIKELNEKLSKYDEIRIWSNHYNIEEYLLLLYLCSYVNSKTINVIFSDMVSINYGIASMSEEELKNIFDFSRALTKLDIIKYKEEWNEIVKINSDLRFFENGKVKSVSYDYFNNIILSELKNKEPIKLVSLVGKLMSEHMLSYTCDQVYAFLIKRLISDGKIVIVKNGEDELKSLNYPSNALWHHIIESKQ